MSHSMTDSLFASPVLNPGNSEEVFTPRRVDREEGEHSNDGGTQYREHHDAKMEMFPTE